MRLIGVLHSQGACPKTVSFAAQQHYRAGGLRQYWQKQSLAIEFRSMVDSQNSAGARSVQVLSWRRVLLPLLVAGPCNSLQDPEARLPQLNHL
jgi:hypothetical protein